jgi:putative restriction endonuclease
VRGYVAPTDQEWYRFLQARPELREVNFWRPSHSTFSAFRPGELFFFKLKSPHNAIGGFGMFTRTAVLTIWEAWDVFGTANGVADLDGLLARLARLRAGQSRPLALDTRITCIAVNEPVLFPPDDWVATPADWHGQIIQGKGYDLTTGRGRTLLETCAEKARNLQAAFEWTEEAVAAARYANPTLIKPRLGQSSFRIAVLDAYDRRCAVTGERSLPVIEASHIKPYAAGGEHAVSNGLPLRRDLHRLFDLGFVTVRPDLHFAVSPSLQDTWANGRVCYDLSGREIGLPPNPTEHPNTELLEWHSEEIFRH